MSYPDRLSTAELDSLTELVGTSGMAVWVGEQNAKEHRTLNRLAKRGLVELRAPKRPKRGLISMASLTEAGKRILRSVLPGTPYAHLLVEGQGL